MAELGHLGNAYGLALDVVASAAARVEGKFAKCPGDAWRTDAILAAYIAGLFLVEHAVLGGFNAQAAALIRQELEAIAALEELRADKRVEGKTPNIKHVPSVPGSIYSELTGAAHFARGDILSNMASYVGELVDSPGSTRAWLLSPQFMPEATSRLFSLHTLLLLHLAEHQAAHYCQLHGTESTEAEIQSFEKAVLLLERAGAINRDA